MKCFREEAITRGWWLKRGGPAQQPPPTHLLLTGGRLAVPDDSHGNFLNVYTNAVLRGEAVSVVEMKTAIFRLFFDVDASFDDPEEARGLLDAFQTINALVAEFWVQEELPRLVVCGAPPKLQDNGMYKVGFHLVWPRIYVNSPIALTFRELVIERFPEASWEAVLDPCVFKANGLRMLYSYKNAEARVYAPVAIMGPDGVSALQDLTAQEKRAFIHEVSVRAPDEQLTPCTNGADKMSDRPHSHLVGGAPVVGRSVKLDVFVEVLPAVQAALQEVYRTQRFTGVFTTATTVYLKSSSRFCHNVGREHCTSTVYFEVTRQGVAQRCYCRKDDRGCDVFRGACLPLPAGVLDAFLGTGDEPPAVVTTMPARRGTAADLKSLLARNKPAGVVKKRR